MTSAEPAKAAEGRRRRRASAPTDADGHRLRTGPILMVALAGLPLVAVVGILLLTHAADHFIKQQAETTSIAWAAYIGAELDRIEDIAHGAPVTEEERAFLDGARQFGDIFRFKLFDSQGRLRLISDDLEGADADTGDLGEHNPKAASVLQTGKPHTEIEDGTDKPDRPDLYVETYVPIVHQGEVVAISEVYIDETHTAAVLTANFWTFGLQIAGLTLLVLLLPVVALMLMARQLERQNEILDAERLRALEAERAKSNFLAHISHELRTPLNAIQGMSQMMVRGDLGPLGNDKYGEYARDITDSANLLLSLINDILDLSKVDAGKFELQEGEVELQELVTALLRITRGWKKADSLDITATGVPSGLVVRADRRALNQILLNLLSNAVKFTPAGGTVDIAASRDEEGACVISVSDSGLGIPPDDLPRILEPFGQARQSANVRHQEGTGLGLTLVDSLVQLHGGRLAIDSELGRGTAVRVTLPAERVVATEAVPA